MVKLVGVLLLSTCLQSVWDVQFVYEGIQPLTDEFKSLLLYSHPAVHRLEYVTGLPPSSA